MRLIVSLLASFALATAASASDKRLPSRSTPHRNNNPHISAPKNAFSGNVIGLQTGRATPIPDPSIFDKSSLSHVFTPSLSLPTLLNDTVRRTLRRLR